MDVRHCAVFHEGKRGETRSVGRSHTAHATQILQQVSHTVPAPRESSSIDGTSADAGSSASDRTEHRETAVRLTCEPTTMR
jgi:hypothetical protein